MEKKLAEYRARKRREEKLNQYKQNVKNFVMSLLPSTKVKIETRRDSEEDLITPPYQHDKNDIPDSEDDSDSVDSTITCQSYTYMTWVLYFLSFVLWFTIFILFVKLDFGMVYIIVSALIFICLNTRTRKKEKGEVSAYSVFNKNCESIDGTLKAEQFEREIRYGSGAVK